MAEVARERNAFGKCLLEAKAALRTIGEVSIEKTIRNFADETLGKIQRREEEV